ncbi:MAG TPA: AAA family ATPase [Chitinophagaceae bacterium]|jgi:predicted kinase|nr:AAA family ATPase [Chitinophagaceae bacterium]
MIVIVLGLPGSGKSYFASRLAEVIQADYINSDQVRKEMFSKRMYSEQEKGAVYNAMLEKMKSVVQLNKDLVIDATFHREDSRQLFIRQLRGKAKFFFIEITANPDLIRRRLKKERPFSEADFDVYELTRHQWQPLSEPHLSLESTDENIDYMLDRAVNYLRPKK